MIEDLNKLNKYLNDSGFKKEASILALLLGLFTGCDNNKSVEDMDDPMEIFFLEDPISSDNALTIFNELLQSNPELTDPNKTPPSTLERARDIFINEAASGVLYKNMGFGNCFVKPKEKQPLYNIPTGSSGEDEESIRIGDYTLEFHCIPIRSESVYYTIDGKKTEIAEPSMISGENNYVIYDEENPMTLYGHQDSATFETQVGDIDGDGDDEIYEIENSWAFLMDFTYFKIGDQLFYQFHQMTMRDTMPMANSCINSYQPVGNQETTLQTY